MSFDGMSADDAARAASGATALMWLPVAGLDRHTPMIGLGVLPEFANTDGNGAGAQRGAYRPICDFMTAPGA